MEDDDDATSNDAGSRQPYDDRSFGESAHDLAGAYFFVGFA